MKCAFGLGLLVTLTLTVSACGSGGGGEHQQAQAQVKGRPLPKYERAVLPAGEYHSTEFTPSLSFHLTGDKWRFEGPSGTLGDPEHPDYLFVEKVPWGEIAFFNLRKVEGVYKPKGPTGAKEPVPNPDDLVGWFRHNPYLKTSDPKPASVGGFEGVQFDVALTNRPVNHKGICGSTDCLDIFALSSGGSSEVHFTKQEHYIVLENVEGVPVVIYYNNVKDDFDEFVPVAEKVLKSVEWTGS
jgi:hypothetical protein